MKTTTFPLCLGFIAVTAFAAPLQDVAAPDAKGVLEFLAKLKAQQEAAIKQRRANAFDVVKAAAASGEKSVALWKDAIKAVQFDGAEDEMSKMRAWREGDGEALNSKEAQTAAKLHLTWLYYTLQFHSGWKKKDLLPSVIDYTNQLVADGLTMESFEQNLEKARERDASGRGARRTDDDRVKRVHDAILNTPVSGSPVAKYLGLDDILPRGPSQNDRTAKAVAKILGRTATSEDDNWPMTPGDLDGIHRAILLPEYRASRDSRVIEYWDYVIKRETDAVTKKRVDYEIGRFNQIRRPELLWQRAQDLLAIGLRNRAILEMLAVLKSNPLHPQTDSWIGELEVLVSGSASAAGATGAK